MGYNQSLKKLILVLSVFLLSVILFIPIDLNAQNGPFPCEDETICQGKCQADLKTCWNIDDPVPLDNGLLILAGAALTFGLYKLNSRKQLSV